MADPTNPGASNTNPSSPASPGGSEGTGNPPSAAQPSGTGAPATTNASSGPAPDSDPIEVFMTAITPLANQLKAALPAIDPAVAKHHSTVGQKQRQVMPQVSAMLRTYPKLSGTTADEFDAATDGVNACTSLSRLLGTVMGWVLGTGRLRQEDNWHVASGAIATARKQAPRNADVANEVGAIDALLAKGPRAEQAGHAAISAQAMAAKAEARATKAAAKSAAATARASALQHGTGDAVITQPAPSAPAPSTTAPGESGATPGTPGSTTIR